MAKFLICGDSYADCNGVKEINDRWPVKLLREKTKNTAIATLSEDKEGESWVTTVNLGEDEVTIIAKTGARSDELLAEVKKHSAKLHDYDWVIIGVGVNDHFQYGECKDEYASNVKQLVECGKAANGNKPENIILYSIPHWQETPAGQQKETHQDRQDKYKVQFDDLTKQTELISKQLNDYNRSALGVAHREGVRFIDIAEVSQKVAFIPGFMLSDGLHYAPSAYEELFIQPLLKEMQVDFNSDNAQEQDFDAAFLEEVKEEDPGLSYSILPGSPEIVEQRRPSPRSRWSLFCEACLPQCCRPYTEEEKRSPTFGARMWE